MYCNRCGSVEHFAVNCPGPDVSSFPDIPSISASQVHELTKIVGCLECGSTAQTFEDAQKWANLRKKRQVYMQKRRKNENP